MQIGSNVCNKLKLNYEGFISAMILVQLIGIVHSSKI